MRVVFAGTPEFARIALEAIHAAGHNLPLVLTQPDRPAGRGLQLAASAVKQWALGHGLPLAQPRGLRLDGKWAEDASAACAAIEAAAPDVMVVAAYGLILPRWVLDTPRLGCLNIHGSLLPRWRGAAPIQRAIEAGDAQTGITLMQMDEGLDTGAMLLTEATTIGADDSAGGLHDRLAAIGARLAVQGLRDAAAGALNPVPQPAVGVRYAQKIDKAEAAIDWSAPAAEIERRVRAFDPAPGCHFDDHGQRVKLWRARVVEASGPAGSVIDAGDAARYVVACGQGGLELLELQPAGSKRMATADWLRRSTQA